MRLHFMIPRSLLSLIFIAASLARAEPPRRDSYGNPLPPGAIYRIGTTRLWHRPGEIPPCHHLLFSAYGKFVLSSSHSDSSVRVWETATGRLVRRFSAGTEHPAFALSPDGTMLAVNETLGISFYELATGKLHRAMPKRQVEITSLAYSPDGKILTALCGGIEYRAGVICWDTATGKKVSEWHTANNTFLALSPDGQTVASVKAKGHLICLRNVADGKSLREWKAEGEASSWEHGLIFSPDGRVLVATNTDAMIRVWDTVSGKLLQKWKGWPYEDVSYDAFHREISCLAFAPDGKVLASLNRDGVLRLWDWRTGRELRHFTGVYGPAAYSRDGKLLAAGDSAYRIRLWDMVSGRDISPFADPGWIQEIDFSPDGRMLHARIENGPARFVDAATGRPRRQLHGYRFLSFSPDGGSLLVLRRKGERWGPLCLVDTATGKERVCFRDTDEKDRHHGWSGGGKVLTTINTRRQDFRVRQWNAATGEKVREWRRNIKYSFLRFAPDMRTVALIDIDQPTIRLLTVDAMDEPRPLRGSGQWIAYQLERGRHGRGSSTTLSPVFAPDGRTVLTAIDRHSFGLWDVADGKRIQRFQCDQFCPEHAEFSPDGRFLVLLDTQGDPCLVDAASGRVRHRLIGKGQEFDRLFASVSRTFSADGRLLAIAYDDHALVLWETATGGVVRMWPGHGKGELRQMEFSPDHRRLATVGADGTALVWDVTGLSGDGRLPMGKLSAEEVDQAWRDLASSDAAKGHRAIWTLVADPERALPLVRQRVHAVPRPEPGRIARLVTDLDSDSFAVRDQATRELRGLGESAEPKLRQVIGARPSLELRRRTQTLLQELDAAPFGARLRAHRAVAVLEYMNDRQSIELLSRLASGAPAASLSREAKAALGRLKRTAEP